MAVASSPEPLLVSGLQNVVAPAATPAAVTAGAGMPDPAKQLYANAYQMLVNRMADPNQVEREYSHICHLDMSIGHSYDASQDDHSRAKNRYIDVLPYDYNRVLLQNEGPYINASYVQLQIPHLQQPCSYIATQGPLPHTTQHFWQMVVDHQVPAIVMLTRCNERGMVKCHPYYPEECNSVMQVASYQIQVQQVVPSTPDCTLRVMRVMDTKTQASHELRHYHFHAWPDHGVPESASSLRTICAALSWARATGKPTLVHCSAGIGRTGTFCAVDITMQRFDSWRARAGEVTAEEVVETLDVPRLVCALRAQRMGMVQTLEQYEFVYQTILEDLQVRCGLGPDSNTAAAQAGLR